MDIPTHAELLEQIDAFLGRHDMAPSRFGRDALGEPQLISQLRQGRKPNLSTVGRLRKFMASKDAEVVERAKAIIAAQGKAGSRQAHRLNAGAR